MKDGAKSSSPTEEGDASQAEAKHFKQTTVKKIKVEELSRSD